MKQQLLNDYNTSLSHSGINGERLASRLDELSAIGSTEDGGSFRLAFSPEEKQAKDLAASWMEEAGMIVRRDGAGNVIGRLEGSTLPGRRVMSGSHLDSVPHGGHFDGPLGVLAAIEVAQAWKDNGEQPPLTFEAVVFSDEEGARFQSGLSGSLAMTGEINLEEKAGLNDESGRSYEEVLSDQGLDLDSVRRAEEDFSDVEAFLEVHIEQGKRLEKAGLSTGVVEGIAGPAWLKVTFTGRAGHAGNTPMDDREDALIAASRFVTEVEKIPAAISRTAVATVGKMHVKPNGVNVIPGEVTLTVDIRDIDQKARDEVIRRTKAMAQYIADDRGVATSTETMMSTPPQPVPEELLALGAEAVEKTLGTKPYILPSGAGHDAMIIGRKAPFAMLFTKSRDGVSHHPAEWSSLSDCVETIHVLKVLTEAVMTQAQTKNQGGNIS
ncbi:Zn-dependent hydrolase [Alkalicoccus saliphilus]|uniref:Zn-dependent hydrolase n=1 Tax=Alkalicoccus saliphilus TaxID=200989 RepID=A0A2T4U459_9BACI|nr:Zn-dependent hydrolase [Alkalicoccus saliphilus]PTL38187.1 Zn-dependent hydrolase [Alkalicoccus saliphilus]